MIGEADRRARVRRVPPERRRIHALVDARYVGQVWTLAIDVPGRASWTGARSPRLRASFDERHRSTYGYEIAGNPVEIVHSRSRPRA